MGFWDMNPIEWYTTLSHFSLWLIATDILLSCCISQEHWNTVFIRRHVVTYVALFMGWMVMRFGVNLNSMDWLVKISIIGWLIWIPALFFASKNLLKKFTASKNFLGISLGKSAKGLIIILVRLITLPFLIFAAIARAKSASTFEMPEHKFPYVNPLNEHTQGIHNVFPNEYARNRSDLIEE